MKKSLNTTTIAASLMLAFGAVHAADQTATSDVFQLGTVSVYGERQTNSEKAESVVDREEINRLEKKDIGSALSLVPGVLYNAPSLAAWRQESNVKVRGFDLREVPIFLDGIPVSIPYDGYSDLGRFKTADVSSIYVAKGYSSVMYGHNTLGGAINIVSLRPRSSLDANVTTGIGSGGTKEFSANVGTLQNNWYLQAGTSYFARDYTRLSENYVGTDANGDMVDSDGWDYRTRDRRYNVKVGFIPNATDEYVLSYSKQEATKKPGDGSNGFRPFRQEWSAWDRETVSFVSNTRFLNNQFYIKPRLYYDTFKNTLDWFQNQPRGSHYDDSAFGASVELGTEIISNHLIKTMISLKDEEHGEFSTDVYTRARIGDPQKVEQKFFSVALEDTWTINKQWEMQAGAIYTRRTAKADAMGANITSLLGQYPAAGSMLSPSIDTVDPQLAFFYKPTTTDTFRASVSKKTRFPSFKQVYSNYGAGSLVACPAGSTTCTPGANVPLLALQNPGLEPEKATHYEIGYLGNPTKDLALEGSVYYSRSRNTISRTDRDFVTFPGYAITQSVNLPGVTERKGIDIGVRYEALSQLSLGLSYGYLNMKNKENASYRFTDIPKHYGVLYAEARPMHWFKVIPSVEFRSSSYYDTAGQNKNPGYGIANLKVSVTPPSWKNVSVNFGVDNMFDKNYSKYADKYASPGRAYYMNLRVDYH